jgi:hypothetical protein
MKKLPDLVGENADVYLVGQREPVRDATVEYVSRSFLGVSYIYRRVRHELHVPVAAVAKIDQRHRLPPRRRR